MVNFLQKVVINGGIDISWWVNACMGMQAQSLG